MSEETRSLPDSQQMSPAQKALKNAPVLSAAQTGLASVILIIISQCIKAAKARQKLNSNRDKGPPSVRTSDSDTQELIAHSLSVGGLEDGSESPKPVKHMDEASSHKESEHAVVRKVLPPLDHL